MRKCSLLSLVAALMFSQCNSPEEKFIKGEYSSTFGWCAHGEIAV